MPKNGNQTQSDILNAFRNLCDTDDGPTIGQVRDTVQALVGLGMDLSVAAHAVAHIGVTEGLFDPDEEDDVAADAQDISKRVPAA